MFNAEDSDQERYVFSLCDDLAINPLPWTQKMLLEFMIVLHQGLHKLMVWVLLTVI